MSRKKYALNLSCGQTDIYPQALMEMGRQLQTPIYYPPYWETELACIRNLKQLLHTQNEVLLMVGTATYGEEAAMNSILEAGDELITVNTGVFGQVLTDLARVVGGKPTEIVKPAGQSVSVDEVRQALKAHPRARMVAVVHVETSRGTMNPIGEIGRMLRAEFPHVLYLIDSVSGLGAAELRLDEWNVDLCCTSSQKAVNAPQGVAIVAVSARAWKAMEARKTPIHGLCLDLITWRRYHSTVQNSLSSWGREAAPGAKVDASLTAYKAAHGPSPSYVLTKALKAATDEILEEGEEAVLRRHRLASKALRAGVRAMGLGVLASESNAAPDATCITIPSEPFDVRRYMSIMWEEHGIATAGGSGSVQEQGYSGSRVGLMGFVAAPESVYALLAAMEQALTKMGYGQVIKPGKALPAAQAVFAAGE
jgi:aspartate aminotransferase-like enzyme